MQESYIYCDRKFIKCSTCSTENLYNPSGVTDNFNIHFEPLGLISDISSEKLNPIKSIQCKKCNKKAKNNRSPYFYY